MFPSGDTEKEPRSNSPTYKSVSPHDVCHVLHKSDLNNAEKIRIIQTCWKPDHSTVLHKQCIGSRQLSFQLKWLEQRRWLVYSKETEFEGGWCLLCVLFLSDQEKKNLGSFVNSPFRKYVKSKECFDNHEANIYHKNSVERASIARAQAENVGLRIDTQISHASMENIERNRSILPHVVNAVLFLCKTTNFSPWSQR